MDEIILKNIETPEKCKRLLIAPSFKIGEFDSHGVDCPFPFYHENRYWMTYVGFDGIGYQTGLACSDDLETWKKKGLLLGRGPKGSITEYNIAMTSILRENEIYSPGRLKKINGQFVGTYHAYPKPGYEAGPAEIGLCYSDDLLQWDIKESVLIPNPDCSWESGGLYKSWILEADGTFYLFYNAKNITTGDWLEQTGVATSTDLVSWERHGSNPILPVSSTEAFDDHFASDPCVLKHGENWVMFYFGLSYDSHARNSAAFSKDLFHWEKSNKILIDIGTKGEIDSKYAHKPGIIAKGDKLYHFYCAVSPVKKKKMGNVTVTENRGISLAVNK